MSSENKLLELTEMFEIQRKFTEKLFAEKYGKSLNDLTHEDRIKWSKEYILSGAKEMFEMLDELNWKTHRYLNKHDNMDNFIEEGIDAFKFLLNLFIINGYGPDKFYEKFLEKSIVVDIRYEQEKQLKEIRKTEKQYVVIDIDGVLNTYPANVIDYFNTQGEKVTDLMKFKFTETQRYKQLKYQYRITGQERNCTVNRDALDFIRRVKEQGYGIILLTARPYNKMTRLFFDTVNWLQDNEIKFDFLFFANDKEKYLLDNFDIKNIKLVVDDQIENVNKLADYFVTYLLYNPQLYNDTSRVSKKVKIIHTLKDIVL